MQTWFEELEERGRDKMVEEYEASCPEPHHEEMAPPFHQEEKLSTPTSLPSFPVSRGAFTDSSQGQVKAEGGMLRLSCAVQTYDWGRPGTKSLVARLKKHGEEDYQVSEGRTYAELWMGTHANGPARIVNTDGSPGEYLKDYIKRNPAAQGTVMEDRGGKLPFMLKVLSINKALSIQAHPDKKTAEMLHLENPLVYPDANHKPEMAISLNTFEAMCGFRPLEEIVQHLNDYPELRSLVTESVAFELEKLPLSETARKHILRSAFSAFVTASEPLVATVVSNLVNRLKLTQEKAPLTDLDAVMLRLSQEYPGDRSMMAPLLLNYVKLGPGSAFVMHANEPHAYLSGDVLECMACSDNVVRAGLTPKFKDVPTLISMLSYNSGAMSILNGTPRGAGGGHRVYSPDGISEFEVEIVQMESGSTYHLQGVNSPGIFLVLEGEGGVVTSNRGGIPWSYQLCKGRVFFNPAGTALQLRAGNTKLKVALAHINLTNATQTSNATVA